MQVISFANQKGGTAKTTTCANIAGIMGNKGLKVLVIDSDPQCNLTLFFENPESPIPPSQTIAAIYEEKIIANPPIIHKTRFSNVDFVPGALQLAAMVSDISQRFDSSRRLQRFLSGIDKYDIVLIDCPPDIGVYTLNAFVASSHIIVPVQPERLALEGFGLLQDKVDMIASFGESLKVTGIVTTMYDGRVASQRDWYSQIVSSFDTLNVGVIHRAAQIGEAADVLKLIVEIDRKSRPYKEHLAVTTEICRRVGLPLNSHV